MKIGTIDNNAQNTLEEYLRFAAKDAIALDWASAFITNSGLNAVYYLLTAVAKRGKVRLLTGLYQGFTEPTALRELLKVQENFNGRLEVHISTDRHFHWKSYFSFGQQTVRVVVGSSNLTNDGLNTSGEFNLAMSLKKNSPELRHIHGVFEKHWKHQSVQLTKAMIGRYAHWQKKAGGPIKIRKPPLASIIQATPVNRPVESNEINYYRDSLHGTYSEETEVVLSKTTNWDKKRYWTFNNSQKYKIGDRVIIFDFVENQIYVVKIVDTTRLPERTPDGLHFAAYVVQHGIPKRRITKRRMSSMKADALLKNNNKKEASGIRKLSAAKFQQFVNNLKKTA